ncbi:filamentous haemagglutinin family protein [Rhodoferax sp. GW822-FHT02A01]|uniref:filamentous haemagglutinin family protein n=1 Tax=Rhodoferax sp. GW822-FHT02A01 TaxID=3141537 RepID=UPI00315D76FA
MNRNCYQLVFSATLGMVVPQAETARRRGKSPASVTLAGAMLAGSLMAAPAYAVLPVAANGGVPGNFAKLGTASYQVNGNVGVVSQVGNKSILNWKSFNIGAGNTVQFRQVDSLATNNLVQGASFTSLNRIWDANPSVISGAITQGAGQQANIILVNNNGIAFMNGAQVNLNNFTASSLNMVDSFITNGLLGGNEAQFNGTKDFNNADLVNKGFIKVMEGAQITAGSQGRVMLLAPTVVNRGTITAPDGQVVLAAGSKAYLRVSDDANLNTRGLLVEVEVPTDAGATHTAVPAGLANSTEDKLGLASNSGTLFTPRGNITMVGYAVNQNGIAKATTSVVSNGSVYLTASGYNNPLLRPTMGDPSATGNVVLGSGSVTTVMPEVADTTTSVDGTGGIGLDKRSEVRVVGNRIYMASGAQVIAPSGKVDFLAVDDSTTLQSVSPFAKQSSTARIDIASGALIDVSGLNDVAVSVARNTVEVQLRGDELKDSPINQVGPLRGQTVYVDIATAQATSNSLIAQDSLTAYAAKTTRTVAERSTAAGTVNIRSEGETILENGSTINLSGGSLDYQSAVVQRSLVSSGGKTVDISKALATTRYTSLASKLVVDYGRWNHTETYSSGPSSRYVEGYVEGKDAGTLNVTSLGSAYIQSDIHGTTTVGRLQRASANTPKGATLTINSGLGSTTDYKSNQQVLIKDGASSLAADFAKDAALTATQQATLEINGQLLGVDKVANLDIYANNSLVSDATLTAPDKGEVTLVATGLTVEKDITVAGGAITLSARNTSGTDIGARTPSVKIADNVALSVGGKWVNDKLAGTAASVVPLLNAGTISVTAAVIGDPSGGFLTEGMVSFGQGASLDASAGAYMDSKGKISNGKAGTLEVSAYGVNGLPSAMQAYGATQGGTLKLTANKIQLGGQAAADTLGLDSGLLTRGGFGSYQLTGLTSLDVAAGTQVLAQQSNRKILSQDVGTGALRGVGSLATGTAMADVGQVLLDDSTVRKAVNVTLSAQKDTAGTGVLTIGRGASLTTEAGGTLNLNALNTLDVEGAVVAHGGTINLLLDRGNLTPGNAADANALWLGSGAVLDASGIAVTSVDSKGQTKGTVYAGGTVNLNSTKGYIAALKGSRISVNGAAPVWLDVKNESGGIGRMQGSEAGSVVVSAQEALVLDSTLQAQGGSDGYRNGNLSITLTTTTRPDGQAGYDTYAREIHLASSVATQISNRTATDVNPVVLPGTVVRSRLGADTIEAGGFDTVSISSPDGIVLEGNVDIGSSRAQPMRELKLDAARIETDGGNVTLTADAVRLGNYDTNNRIGTAGTSQSAGTLTANARMLELAGNLRLKGMASSTLTGTELVQLSGITRDKLDAAGKTTDTYENSATITSTGNLTLQAGVVTPSTYADITLQAPSKTIRFEAVGDAPTQPLSALGRLEVDAANIEQAGRIWAPLGQIALNAGNAVTLSAGSVTSVAADAGSILPLGQIQNGLKWVVNVDPAKVPKGQLEVSALPQKSVSVSATAVDMQSGSTVNVAGGGDVQAYEFTVGPGGSRDILSDANIYAVVPSFKGGFAPSDPQESFNLRVGTSIYLSGVPGLKAGTYTLLPAHYALLPGAYAVRLDTASSILPGQEYTRQDGVRIASGYLTDSRANAPRDATWKGFEVLTGAQVHARSELTVTQASDFFASSNGPADAGQLSISTTGQGASSLQLNGTFVTAAASGGKGAVVDISANELAIVNSATAGNYGTATQVNVDTLNAMGASSLLLGGTRTVSGSTTSIQVGANNVTLDNGSATPLQAPEVILAANNAVDLKAGSKIVADGSGTDGGTLTTSGMGALVRVANSTATLVRSGNPGSTRGTVTGDASSVLQSAKAITLDATKDNSFKGSYVFQKDGKAVAGYLSVGASKINFGNTGSTPNVTGLTYTQAQLDALSALASMSLVSYSTFDMYGDVQVGGLNESQRPTLASLTLQGAGIVGHGTAGNAASIHAQTVQLSNPGGVAFSNGGVTGAGQLHVVSDTLVLGNGDKTLDQFSNVSISSGQVVGQGTGSLNVNAPVVVNTARITGAAGSDQTLAVNGGSVAVNALTSAVALTPVTELGAKWTLSGDSVAINTEVDLYAGSLKVVANSGDVILGANAKVDVSGQTVSFFDQQRVSSAGRVELTSAAGNVRFDTGAWVDVSGAAGGDAGTLVLSAKGSNTSTVQLASGNVRGTNAANAQGESGEGARVQVDVGTLASFSSFNGALGSGFVGERQLRVRNGDVTVDTADVVRAKTVDIAADAGRLTVKGSVVASGAEQGSISLNAGSDLTLASTASLSATSSASGKAGGKVALGSTSGKIRAEAGSNLDVSALAGGVGGQVNLRAARTDGSVDTGVKVEALNGSITGASSVVVEAVKTYTGVSNITGTLTSTAWNNGSTLTQGNMVFDNASVTAHAGAIASALSTHLDPSLLHVRAGVEVQSALDLSISSDLNFATLRTSTLEPGALTLRASRNLNVNANVSDGFVNATRNTTPTGSVPTSPLALNADGSGKNSWSYRFVAGADTAAANVMTTKAAGASAGNLALAADKMIRTGTGSIALAAANDITLGSTGSVVYTAGQLYSATLSDFVAPISAQNAKFTRNGGDVSLKAGGNVRMVASDQLYSEWLFRQGRLSADGTYVASYTQSGVTSTVAASPAWWTRFDLFKQGVATLGGGNVSITAGADLINVGASAATQGRLNSATADASKLLKTGGGNVRLEAGGNVLGGEFYADNGSLVVKAGGQVGGAVNSSIIGTVYPVIALGDASAKVQALGDINILAVVNPTLLPQSVGSNTTGNLQGNPAGTARRTAFSTYGDTSEVSLSSLSGDVVLHTATGGEGVSSLTNAYTNILVSSEGGYGELINYMPSRLEMLALQGNVKVGVTPNGGVSTLMPSTTGQLDLLAKGSVTLNSSLTVSDRDPALIPAPATPIDPSLPSNVLTSTTAQKHASTPVHANDTEAAHIYAVTGDVSGVSQATDDTKSTTLDISKAVQVRAGEDVTDFNAVIQNANTDSVSLVQAGRDIVYAAATKRTENDGIKVAGSGRLEVTAGRNLDLGTSGGIRSLGNQENVNLPSQGADLQLAAGVGAQGIDYVTAVQRLLTKLEAGSTDDATLWEARWLAGDDSLNAAQARTAVAAIASQNTETHRQKMRNMVYTALRTTGRDYNDKSSAFKGDYARGYAALELLFPGISTKSNDGTFANYKGNVNLFASRVKSESGGDIEFMVPGGKVVVGLANTPEALVGSSKSPLSNVLGMVVAGTGNIKGFARSDIIVNQSRILTLGGGDVMLWSSEGGIDAGKGKKTASAVPPPLLVTNYETGTTSLVLQGAATGSGIGALATAGVTAGDVDLVAPKGTVNAGDAGIRAGNLNVAALDFKGADNVTVSGKSVGVPVADMSAVTAAASGASSMSDDASKTIAAASQSAADSARSAQALATSLRPPVVRVDVLGFGE